VKTRSLAVRAAVLVVLAIAPDAARAQVFGQFTGAEPLPVNGRLFGAYLETSENVLGATGQLRLSFYPGVDFGFQGGLARVNLDPGSRTTIRFGTDVKAAVLRRGDRTPYALSIDGAIGVESSDSYNVLTLAPGAVMSRPYLLGGSVNVEPYGGVQLAFTTSSIHGRDKSEMSLPLRVGSQVAMGSGANFVFELQLLFGTDINDKARVVAGASFPF
jgi:hypothetical protein